MKENTREPGHTAGISRNTLRQLARAPASVRAEVIAQGRAIADLERQLADERARIDCSTRGGWLSEDLECAGEDGPACWKHLLAEVRGKLKAVWPYVRHGTWCPHGPDETFEKPCDCGLDLILKEE